YPFHVVGNRIRLASSEAANAKIIDLRTDGIRTQLEAQNSDLHIGAINGNTVLQASGHRVGIGALSPDMKLHVEGEESNGVSTGTVKITSGEQNMILDGNEIDVPGGGLFLQNNSANRICMVTGGGSVGVGLSDPEYKMHVVGDRIRLGNNNTPQAKTIDMRTDGAQVDIMASNAHLFLGSNTGNTIIQGFGRRVGIGTGTPTSTLHIDGDESNGSTGALKVTSGTQNLVMDGNEIDASNALYLNNNSDGPVMLALGGGNVRIGGPDIAPSVKLDVSGDLRCFNIFTNSDRRYKTGIRTLEGALGKVLAMRGTSYDFAAAQLPEGYTAGKQIGFIAQEMKEVMPELVKEDAQGMMSVNYVGVIPVLVEALKEQHEVISELEAQNTELKERLSRIEAALGLSSTERQQPANPAAAVSATISPNPTSGFVTLNLSNAASAQALTVRILDYAGREVASRHAAGETTLQFDLRNQPAGTYTAQVLANGKLLSTQQLQ
ncbi:MAG TPA: tail fiber domain-containing protein, partial [Saprospiraceae bacterium]|nr:tail fiber domain-containing protein [Saprospiraceae bacterium]